jgi:hypothetical protein
MRSRWGELSPEDWASIMGSREAMSRYLMGRHPPRHARQLRCWLRARPE